KEDKVGFGPALKSFHGFSAAGSGFHLVMGHFQQALGVKQNTRVIVDNQNAFFAGSQRRALHRFGLFLSRVLYFFSLVAAPYRPSILPGSTSVKLIQISYYP